MKKKWLALAVTGALCLGLTGCNSDGKTEEAKAESASEIALAENNETENNNKIGADKVLENEGEAVKALDNNFINPLCAFELTVNGDTLKLPMTYADFEAAGWTYAAEDFVEIEGQLSEFGQSWTKNGVTLDVTMSNPNEASILYTESIISGLDYTPHSIADNSNADTVVLPGGIQLYESTYDDMLSVYGVPNVIDKDYSSLYFVEYNLDENHEVTFSIDAETNIVDGVEFECVDAVLEGYSGINYIPNNNVPAETPAEAPEMISAVSLNPADMQFELDGVVYQLPCSTQELMANGWTITEGNDEIITAGDYQFGVIEKNGVEFNVYFMPIAGEDAYAENAHVVGLTQMFMDEVYPFVVAGDITLGAPVLEEHIMNVFAGMNIEKDDTDPDYIFYEIDSMDGKLCYSIGVSGGVICSMTMEFGYM